MCGNPHHCCDEMGLEEYIGSEIARIKFTTPNPVESMNFRSQHRNKLTGVSGGCLYIEGIRDPQMFFGSITYYSLPLKIIESIKFKKTVFVDVLIESKKRK